MHLYMHWEEKKGLVAGFASKQVNACILWPETLREGEFLFLSIKFQCHIPLAVSTIQGAQNRLGNRTRRRFTPEIENLFHSHRKVGESWRDQITMKRSGNRH
ncbi:hypothetical protein OUZ56_021851 [Daphnia magna]|uniref:Uncharacterized protein n=1 Tax=Daphnia magna TaxID=35525 RepID=A0ABR0AUN7_9CRUS|nr:hypothetical protein OUZ56_021851 [Daphnia magna]